MSLQGHRFFCIEQSLRACIENDSGSGGEREDAAKDIEEASIFIQGWYNQLQSNPQEEQNHQPIDNTR
jgi:hypothetical protein